MKQLITLLLSLLIIVQIYGQGATKKHTIVLNSIKSPKIKVIKQLDSKPGQGIISKYYILYNNEVMYLDTELPESLSLDSCLISTQQLDGIGQPEVIIKLSKNYGSSSASTTEIWNLDTKQQIFKVVNSLWARCENMCFAKKPLVFCNFDYSLQFDEQQNIIVRNLSNEALFAVKKDLAPTADSLHTTHVPCCSCNPNQQEGVFTLVNGKYIWAREN